MKTSRVAEFLKKIQERGARITKSRTRIVEYLLSTSQPQSIQDIVKAVRGDTVSVYRTIAFLKKEGFVEELMHPSGVSHFALHESHHDHLMCTVCGYTLHIPCAPRAHRLPRHEAFKEVSGHQITYLGTCVQCAR